MTPTDLHEHDDSTWDFSSRLQAGRAAGSSSSLGSRHGTATMHLKPTRHASLDAGHLQHRMYAAAQVLDRPTADAGQEGGYSRAVQGSKTRSPGSATPNEGIEIAWVWPPCLAIDAGPVEFAVNVAPREWLNGKHSHRRVPCWPVSGLSLHITYGEQLLSVEELDICGTTKVRLQLPPALTTSPHLNFITVMLVDHGKVGPATQLLTMPSSAADEFSGLFRILVEHEMLPQTAAHPEYVSMLFGSSGCSSGSTVHSYNSFLSLNGSNGAVKTGALAAAAAAAAARANGHSCMSPTGVPAPVHAAAAGTSLGPGAPVVLPVMQGGFLQQQQQQLLLQQQGHRQHVRHRKHKPRRHSAGYVQVSGAPAVVKQWSASVTASPMAGQPAAAADEPTADAGAQSSAPHLQRIAEAAIERRPRVRRASDGGTHLHSGLLLEGTSLDDSSGNTLTTVEGSCSGTSNSRVLHMLTTTPNAAMQQGSCPVGCAGEGAAQVQGPHMHAQQGSQGSYVCSDLGMHGPWEAAAAGVTPAAALLLIGDDDDADELRAEQAAAAAVAAVQDHAQGVLAVEVEVQESGRKSLSLDRCAVHVHNEVERAQRTRTRMSLDEGVRTRMSLDESVRAGGSSGTLQPPAALVPNGVAAAAVAGVASAAGGSSALFATAGYGPGGRSSVNTVPAIAAAAAAAAAILQQNAVQTSPAHASAAAAGFGGCAIPAAGAGASPAEHAAATSPPLSAEAGDASLLKQQGVGAADGSGMGAAASAQMLFGSRGLDRRTAAEANMAAAFTTAWTCHMLELASDLQYLVVCVPNAFASNLETWFGRIIDSRSSIGGTGSSPHNSTAAAAPPGSLPAGLPGAGSSSNSSDRRAESSWDSAMYMKRLGQVLDTLQEHKMWTTMSLLLQHCSAGGLDLYPAGCLHQHLQQQQQQQQVSPDSAQLQVQGPLDPTSLTPQYLEYLGSLDVGSASYWVRPVPAMLNTQLSKMPRLGTTGRASAAAGTGLGKPPIAAQSARAAYLQAAGVARRGATSIDLTPADLAAARHAAAAVAADRRAASRYAASSASRRTQRQQEPQQHDRGQHRAPRRSLSWPLGVLYSAFSWAQTAQSRHRQRSFWQRAWGLHPLIEGSERGSESSAASSMDASSYRSSSSTQRSSTVTSLDDAAPWARRVSAGLGRLAGGPAAAVAAAAAAATGGRGSRGSIASQHQDRDAAARRSSSVSERSAAARGSWTASQTDTATRGSTGAMAASEVATAPTAVAVSGPRFCDAGLGQGSDAAGPRDSNAVQRIAALQNSLFAQAALPPEKVESLKAAVQARAQRSQQQPPQQQQVGSLLAPQQVRVASATSIPAAGTPVLVTVATTAASSSQVAEQQVPAAKSRQTVATAAEGAAAAAVAAANGGKEEQQQERHAKASAQPAAAAPSASSPAAAAAAAAGGEQQQQGPALPATSTAAAAAAAVAASQQAAETTVDESAATAAGPVETVRSTQPASFTTTNSSSSSSSSSTGSSTSTSQPVTRQQRKAAAAAAAADAADHRAAVVAAALTVVGVVEQCTSQLLMVLMVMYCLCFLPSIIPGLQPPHLVEAMSRRPAWMEGLLLVLIGLHWFAVTNVSIVRASSQRPRTAIEAHRAAVAAVEAASSAMVAAAVSAAAAVADAGDAASLEARKRRRKEEHRLQRLRDRQQRLLGRAMLSSVAAAVALGLLCYSLWVFVATWADQVWGNGAGGVWRYQRLGEWQRWLVGRG